MQIDLATHRTLADVRQFLEATPPEATLAPSRTEAYAHVERTVRRFSYWKLPKRAERGLLRTYLQRTTGLSRAQVARLIAAYIENGGLADGRKGAARPFRRRYTRDDILLLAETDALHGTLSGPATMALLRRAFEVFGDERYERLAGISHGHLYNLRHSKAYVRVLGNLDGTRPAPTPIGERRKPRPEGRPGWVRVDSVHQGDLDKVKGVYHINAVDEVTQYQFTGCVERISERYLLPVLERLLASFPFAVHGFHSDNGSEYINYQVAELLEKLRVEEFTKSRPRRSNDNALAESKNGSVIRKQFGYEHIPGRHAERLDRFHREVLAPYLNYHRPCLFPHVETDAKGKRRKAYRQADIRTPYERLKALPEAARYLKPGTSFAELDREAHAQTDHAAARALQEAREALFAELREAA